MALPGVKKELCTKRGDAHVVGHIDLDKLGATADELVRRVEGYGPHPPLVGHTVVVVEIACMSETVMRSY